MTVQVSKLANGLTVATDTMQQAQSVALGFWVKVGTRDESVATQGVAHLVEHMLFKGTRRRDARAISEAIEGVGGYINAYTSREETAYYVHILPEHTALAVDVLSDMLAESVLDPTELERERGVIIQEIGQAYDNPEDYIFDCVQEVAFPAQGLGWPILGQASNIAKLPREALQDYLSKHYHASAMVLAGAGRIEHEHLLAVAERFCDKFPAGTAIARPTARYSGGRRHEPRQLEQQHLVLGFQAPSLLDGEFEAMQLLANLLGGGSASRLFQEVREKRGLAYHVSASLSSYRDAGLLLLYAGTAPEQAKLLEEVMWQELARLPFDLTLTEFQRAQAQLRAQLIMGQETPSARCEQLAGDMMLWGRPVALQERLQRLTAIAPERIRTLAQKLTPTTATIVGVGESG